ncbi:flagellar biosynthesis protein [Paenibacillus sp. J5C_2022]|uniref:TIGR02530 family flagellar biosynthesis protein n=1 Tax=Paenibacillus sp. J5C2022 TaxID=2977129 RepID=UPI0021D0C936|nr:TIGR02530 family flagellar biosynthesis protein [Paenibacillus sp. J5C2022]MCU6707107.1 flagellar biosynthesis protein [Paenibacillus sp. J5C2022]
MSDSVKIGHFFPVKGTPLSLDRRAVQGKEQTAAPSEFRNMLQSELLKFSHHAELRMEQRGIRLKPESLTQIMKAVDEAALKGAKDSLIVYRDIAMIVNVPTRTVVTALDGQAMKSNVFTQIDSAIILS